MPHRSVDATRPRRSVRRGFVIGVGGRRWRGRCWRRRWWLWWLVVAAGLVGPFVGPVRVGVGVVVRQGAAGRVGQGVQVRRWLAIVGVAEPAGPAHMSRPARIVV